MSAATIRRTCTGLLAGATLLLAAGCGSDSGSTATDEPGAGESTSQAAESTSASPEGPACAEIWVEGHDLAATYAGCVDDTGAVEPHTVGCSSGQTFVLYGDDFWAVEGGLIKYAAEGRNQAKAYLADMAACRG